MFNFNSRFLICWTCIVFCGYSMALQWKGQDQYVFELHRAEVDMSNPTVLKDSYIKSFKINRKDFAYNASFHLLVPLEKSKVALNIKAFKKVGQEYTLKLVDFNMDFCEVVKRSFFDVAVLRRNGVVITDCPINPGFLSIYNQHFNGSSFPPNIPKGSYKLTLNFWRNQIQFLGLSMYGELIYKKIDNN